jgi:hypothetical protein
MTDNQIHKLAAWMGIEEVRFQEWRKDGVRAARPDWNPFSSIADAWMLVEHAMKEHHYQFWMTGFAEWRAQFFHNFDKDNIVVAPTAPKAICKAVLRLIGGE